MDRSVAERLGEGLVHEAVLLEQRQPLEPRARDRHLKMVAAAGAVVDPELFRIRERCLEKIAQPLGRHDIMLARRSLDT